MIRVAILADSPSRARSLADLLAEEERLEIVEARAAGARSDRSPASADVLIAAGLPANRIPRNGPPVLAITDEPTGESNFGAPVHAWLPIDSPPAELVAAIFALAHDLFVLTPDQRRRWLPMPQPQNDAIFVEALTPRELQVLRMLADGLANKEIAAQLGISTHTAKFHVAQILTKLGATSRAEAVARGIRTGLVPI